MADFDFAERKYLRCGFIIGVIWTLAVVLFVGIAASFDEVVLNQRP